MMGNERIQAMRASQNPMTRQKRRANTHQRTQAPDPNAQIQQRGSQQGPQEQQMDPRQASYLERLDVMRQATPAVSIASGGRAPQGGQGQVRDSKSGSTPEGDLPLMPVQQMLYEKMQRLLALQDQINQRTQS